MTHVAHPSQLTEGSIVAASPSYLATLGKPELRWARGKVTLIEHMGGKELANVTWDFNGIPDTLEIENLVDAREAARSR